mgnify:CR=1 FL=1
MPDDIRKKLPSMYHQFMQLAGLDITTTPMEVGPTTHYVMGGVKVDGAKLVKTDIAADNGVIHVIDSVILPK